VKTFSDRILVLVICVAGAMVLSWVAIYAFWFAAWTFHSVPVIRFAEAIGDAFLTPAQWIFNYMGGDQTTIFDEPVRFAMFNGAATGIPLYFALRIVGLWREALAQHAPIPKSEQRRVEAKVGSASGV
jgi:hypothetical protein